MDVLGDYELARALQEQEDRQYARRLQGKLETPPTEHAEESVRDEQIQEYHELEPQFEAEEEEEVDNFYETLYEDVAGDFAVTRPVTGKPRNRSDDASEKRSMKKFQPGTNRVRTYSDRIDLSMRRRHVSHTVHGKFRQSERELSRRDVRRVDIGDRATVESVLDYRTRMILFKLINRKQLGSINGCVSTGKEANVYYGKSFDREQEFAIKVYKTSILQFKDRDRYVEGEFRFQRFSRSNPRKMVAMWAEKEMRNLKRLEAVGILVPKVHVLRQHVLVMQFVGNQGWPAKLLKDKHFRRTSTYRRIYKSVVRDMRVMFQKAKLIHADLSEYNILYHKGEVWIIDVSQSVECDHPNALVFLKMDCRNVRDFFFRKGVEDVLSIRQMFQFITADASDILPTDEPLEHLDRLMKESFEEFQRRDADARTAADLSDRVFLSGRTPQRFDEIQEENFDEFKAAFLKKGNEPKAKLRLADVVASSDDEEEEEEGEIPPDEQEDVVGDLPEPVPTVEEEERSSEEGEGEEEGTSEEDLASAASGEGQSVGDESAIGLDAIDALVEEAAQHRDLGAFLQTLPRKVRKKVVKKMKSNRRKTKVPKKVKQRRKKVAKRGNRRNRKNN